MGFRLIEKGISGEYLTLSTFHFTVVLALGVKESTTMNNVFTLVNLAVVTYVIICGSVRADVTNWSISPDRVRRVLIVYII